MFRSDGSKLMIYLKPPDRPDPSLSALNHDSPGRLERVACHSSSRFHSCLRAPSSLIPPFGLHAASATFPFLLYLTMYRRPWRPPQILARIRDFVIPCCNRFWCLSSRPTFYISRPRRGKKGWTFVIVSHCFMTQRLWILVG